MRSINLLLGIVVVLLLASATAQACSCIMPGPPCEAYGKAAAVFVGTVTGVREKKASTDDWSPVGYTFLVEQAYSGVPGTEVEVFTGHGGGDCGYQFAIGRRYLVYAYRNKDRLATSICSRTKLFTAATEDLAFLGTLSQRASGVTLSGEVRHSGVGGKFAGSDALVIIEGDGPRREVRPDTKGDFQITGLAPGKYKVGLKLPDKFTTSTSEYEVTIAEQGCTKVVWYVRDNGQISGRVVSAEGEPVPLIHVSLKALADLETTATSGSTDEKGQFTLSPVPPGRYLLAVNHIRYRSADDPTYIYPPAYYPGVIEETLARVIDLGAGEKLTDLEIRMPPKRTPSIVEGSVVSSDGSLVENAHVVLKDITEGDAVDHGIDFDKGRFKYNGYVGQKVIIEARIDSRPERRGQVTITLERSAERVRIVIPDR